MEAVLDGKKQPNTLMLGLLSVSLVVHFFIFLHISGIYRSNALQYIELALASVSKPDSRAIPRPTHRPKPSDRPHDIQRVTPKMRMIPQFKPIQVAPVAGNFSGDIVEGISMPNFDAGTAGMENYSLAGAMDTGAQYTTAKGYLEMVMLKIETKKHYPETAKNLREEGRVGVAFTITRRGVVTDVRIETPSRHESLNHAAVNAVKDAAPFPKPPIKFFKKDVPLRMTIIFEIT